MRSLRPLLNNVSIAAAMLALGVWGCRTFGVEPGLMMRLGGGMQRSEVGGRRALTLV